MEFLANLDWKIVGRLAIIGIPALSVIFIIIKKFFPKSKKYLQIIYNILFNANKAIDQILESFPNNPTLNSINDVVDQLLEEFHQAGFKEKDGFLANTIKNKAKKKVINKVKKKNGFSVDEDGKIHFNVYKEF